MPRKAASAPVLPPRVGWVDVGKHTPVHHNQDDPKKVVIHVPKGVIVKRLGTRAGSTALEAANKKPRKSRAKPKPAA